MECWNIFWTFCGNCKESSGPPVCCWHLQHIPKHSLDHCVHRLECLWNSVSENKTKIKFGKIQCFHLPNNRQNMIHSVLCSQSMYTTRHENSLGDRKRSWNRDRSSYTCCKCSLFGEWIFVEQNLHSCLVSGCSKWKQAESQVECPCR